MMHRDFAHVKRVVVKIGTNLLSNARGIDAEQIERMAANIAALRQQHIQVLLVSSGAIGLGARLLGRSSAVRKIALRQACASIGQPLLMSHYRLALKKFDLIPAQLLITRSDLNERRSYVNLRNAVENLLDLGVVPVFNENDVVSTAEIGTAFGDNDQLSAFVASKTDADLLIILTDIDGLYTKNPKKEKDGRLISEIEHVDDAILACAGEAGSTFSTGGMKTKILAAEIAANAGCATIIANGGEKDILPRLVAGETLGTWIHAAKRMSQRARWILNSSAKGTIKIDDGAVRALYNHKSLLPSGVVGVEGVFRAGDVVYINKIAKAVPYYSSEEIKAMAGRQSADMVRILGTPKRDVLFRPEDIVFLDPVKEEI